MKYNLTTHVCPNTDVELEPRLPLLSNQKNALEVIDKVKKAIATVPKDVEVVIGGHPQYVSILMQVAPMMRWRVWFYSTYDGDIYTAAFLSRQDRFEIERITSTRSNEFISTEEK